METKPKNMAQFVCLLEKKPFYEEELYHAIDLAEYLRDIEYNACVRIQAWFRGTKIRAYMRYLNQCATKIQKIWRAIQGRKFAKALKKYREESRLMYHRDMMAKKIQAIWRGYYCRKYLFNFKERKKHFQGLALINEVMRMEMCSKAAELEEEQRIIEVKKNELMVKRWAEKHHYLVSTNAVPGVYNSPYRDSPDCIELEMRKVKVSPGWKPPRKDGIRDRRPECKDDRLSDYLNQQGPFKDPSTIHQLKCRPAKPSLRCETDYESVTKARMESKLQGWTKRICDEDFVASVKLPPLKYLPSVCYVGAYAGTPRLKTGSAAKNFRTIFPKLSLFDDCDAN